MQTLTDHFDRWGQPAEAPAYRPRQGTLIDPFEITRAQQSSDLDLDFALLEEPERDPCRVITETAPRGVTYEAWHRARTWG